MKLKECWLSMSQALLFFISTFILLFKLNIMRMKMKIFFNHRKKNIENRKLFPLLQAPTVSRNSSSNSISRIFFQEFYQEFPREFQQNILRTLQKISLWILVKLFRCFAEEFLVNVSRDSCRNMSRDSISIFFVRISTRNC